MIRTKEYNKLRLAMAEGEIILKLIKLGVVVVVVILVLNALGLLRPDFSKKVDDTSKVVKEKVLGEWEKSPLAQGLSNELVKTVVNSSVPAVKFEHTGGNQYSLKGNTLTGTYNSNDPKYLELKFDATDVNAVRQAESVISLFKGEQFHFVPDQIKDATTVTLKLTSINGQIKTETNIGKLKI